MAPTTKTKIPDGHGGWTDQEVTIHAGSKADPAKQQQAASSQFIEDAGSLTEQIMKFDKVYISDHGLAKEHRAFAAALYCVNLRESYPDGADAFDKIAEAARKYYDENKDKAA